MKKQIDYVIKWRKKNPIKARAVDLVAAYNKADIKMGRGKGDLTGQWVVENIFTKPCAHCGKTGWKIIGCNRLDNSKPHTMDNVEPCCRQCNANLRGIDTTKEQSITVYQYTLDGILVAIWKNAYEAAKTLNFSQRGIWCCCNGGYFDKTRNKWHKSETYKGYKWSYMPL